MDAKYFIGCKSGKKIRPLLITFPPTCGYSSKVKSTQYMSFGNKDGKLSEKYKSIIKKFDDQPVYGREYLILN